MFTDTFDNSYVHNDINDNDYDTNQYNYAKNDAGGDNDKLQQTV